MTEPRQSERDKFEPFLFFSLTSHHFLAISLSCSSLPYAMVYYMAMPDVDGVFSCRHFSFCLFVDAHVSLVSSIINGTRERHPYYSGCLANVSNDFHGRCSTSEIYIFTFRVNITAGQKQICYKVSSVTYTHRESNEEKQHEYTIHVIHMIKCVA